MGNYLRKYPNTIIQGNDMAGWGSDGLGQNYLVNEMVKCTNIEVSIFISYQVNYSRNTLTKKWAWRSEWRTKYIEYSLLKIFDRYHLRFMNKIFVKSRLLDKTRPITLVINADYKTDHASQHFDVIAINRWHEYLYMYIFSQENSGR